jgi:hypothetical protein
VVAWWRGANGAFPPWIEGRCIHRGVGKLVLTLVAMGRSAGVGEEGWRMLAGVGEDDGGAVARKQGRLAMMGLAPPHRQLRASW